MCRCDRCSHSIALSLSWGVAWTVTALSLLCSPGCPRIGSQANTQSPLECGSVHRFSGLQGFNGQAPSIASCHIPSSSASCCPPVHCPPAWRSTRHSTSFTQWPTLTAAAHCFQQSNAIHYTHRTQTMRALHTWPAVDDNHRVGCASQHVWCPCHRVSASPPCIALSVIPLATRVERP